MAWMSGLTLGSVALRVSMVLCVQHRRISSVEFERVLAGVAFDPNSAGTSSAPVGSGQEQPEVWASTCKSYPGKRIVVVAVSDEYVEMFRNWLYHASLFLDQRTEQVVVAAESQSVVPTLRNISGQFGVNFDVRFDSTLSYTSKVDSESYFLDDGVWSNVVVHRPTHILKLLNEGCTVLYEDIDQVWVKPVFPVLDAAGWHDLLVTDDGADEDSENLCSCLLYFQPTDASRRLVRSWIERCKDDNNDQPGFNGALRSMGRQIRFAQLPPAQFPPGIHARRYIGTAVILHANYRTGMTEKVAFMREFGMWNVSLP